MYLFNQRRPEKLRSVDAGVAGITSAIFTNRTTCGRSKLAPSAELSVAATSVTVAGAGVDVEKRFQSIFNIHFL